MAAASLRAIFPLLVARAYGEVGLGAWVLAWSWVDSASKIGVAGLDNAVTAEVARRVATGDRLSTPAVRRRATRIGVVASSVVGGAMAVIALLLARATSDQRLMLMSLAIMALALPAVASSRISNGVSRGYHQMQHDLYSRGIGDTLAFLVVFGVCIALGVGAIAPAIATAMGSIASGWIAWRLARRLVGREDRRANDAAITTALVARAAPVAGYSLLNLLILRLDVLVLGAFVGSPMVTAAAFGIYCAAAEIAGSLRKVRQAFDPVFMPLAAGQSETPDTLRLTLARLTRWTLLLSVPMILGLIFAGESVLRLYGKPFRAGAPWLMILTMANIADGLFGVAETALMVKRPDLNLVASGVTLVVQVALCLLLIPQYGPTGAALAMAIAFAIQLAIRFWQMSLVYGWTWPWRACAKPALAGAAGVIVAILCRQFGSGGLLSGGIALFAALATYVAVLLSIGLDREDIAVLSSIRRRLRAGSLLAAQTP